MLIKSSLNRAFQSSTIGVQQRLERRRDEAYHAQWGEREQQFQFDFSGAIGDTFPAEGKLKVLFDVVFAFDAGAVRDSQLGQPLFRHGIEFTSAPPYCVAYAHVSDWIQDESFNYIGAHVMLGVHAQGPTQQGSTFQGVLHLSFQGWGSPMDPFDGETTPGTPDNNPSWVPDPKPTPSPAPPPGAPGGPPVPVSGGGGSAGGTGGGGQGGNAPPPTSGGGGLQPNPNTLPMPTYPAGPLGAALGISFTQVAAWTPYGALSDWTVPSRGQASPTEVPMAIANNTGRATDDGRIGPASPYDVFRNIGDKYAAIWTAAQKAGGGYKVRAHFKTETALDDKYNVVYALAMNMEDRHNGLAFFFGPMAIGWTTNLRVLGDNLFQFYRDQIDAAAGLRPGGPAIQDPTGWVGGKRVPGMRGQDPWLRQQDSYRSSDPMWNPALRFLTNDQQVLQLNARYRFARAFETTGVSDVWVEMWRYNDDVWVAVYFQDPDTPGVVPMYATAYSVKNHPRYGPGNAGHWGFTLNSQEDGGDWHEGKNLPADVPVPGMGWNSNLPAPRRGILGMKLFKQN